MAKANANDLVSGVRSTADTVEKFKRQSAEAMGAVMQAIIRLLDDADRMGGPVVPILEWAEELDGPKMKAVTERVLLLSDCNSGTIKETVKAATNRADAEKLRLKLEGRARTITKAMQLVAANALLSAKTEDAIAKLIHEGKTEEAGKLRLSTFNADGTFRIPLQWYTPDDYIYAGMPSATATFMYGNSDGGVFLAYKKSDKGTDDEGKLHEVKYRPNMGSFIDLAYNRVKAKRGARAGGNATSEGTDGAEATGQAHKPATVTEAQDVLAKEAGRDDFKHRPTGEREEDWQTFFETCATNPFYRAMMIKAISRANKAEAESAKAA